MKKSALLLVLLASTFLVRSQTFGCTSGDCVNGHGTYVWDSYVGDKTYTGNWKNGKMDGYGLFLSPFGGRIHVNFKQGILDGWAIV